MSQEIEKSYFLDFIPLLTIITVGPLGPDYYLYARIYILLHQSILTKYQLFSIGS